MQRCGRVAMAGQPAMVRVKTVRVELHVLLSHLFYGANPLKMYDLRHPEARQGDGEDADGKECIPTADPEEAGSSRQAETDQRPARPPPMVCHRDLPGFSAPEFEQKPGHEPHPTRLELIRNGDHSKQPSQPRCLHSNCISLMHVFPSNGSINARTGRKRQQLVGRKRRSLGIPAAGAGGQ